MSKKQNRIRTRRARQQQELLSLRAELVLLYDGAPMPNHYLELDRLQTRELVRAKRFYMDNTPMWMRPQPTQTTYTHHQIAYQAQLNKAAAELAADIDAQVMKEALRLTRSE